MGQATAMLRGLPDTNVELGEATAEVVAILVKLVNAH